MGKVGRFVTKRILFLNLRGDMQLPEGAESAPHRGGNARGKTSKTRYDRCEGRYRTGDYAREKTSERFHFYSPTSAAGARGVVIIPPHISTSKRLHKSPANISGRWNIYDVQIHSNDNNPTCAVGGRGAIEVRRLRRGKLRFVIYHLLVSFLCDVANSAS